MITRRSVWAYRTAAFALALSVVVACNDDTTGVQQEPLTPDNASEVMNGVVTTFFEGNDAAISLEYFGDYIGMALGGGPALAPAGMNATSSAGWNHLVQNFAPVLGVPANIPQLFQGTTFEWDTLEGGYIPTEREGASQNGVRFILYAVNPITLQPVSPLNEVGYIDLIDTSSFPTVALDMAAVIGEDTLISVGATGTLSDTLVTFNIDGYFSNGQDQLDFTLDASDSDDGTTIIDFQLEFDGYTAHHTWTETQNGVTLEQTLSDGVNEIAFQVDLLSNFGDYVIQEGSGVYFNDELVAALSGTVGEDSWDVTLTNAEGDPLTPTELQALGEVFDVFAELNLFFNGMLNFAFSLVTIAVG